MLWKQTETCLRPGGLPVVQSFQRSFPSSHLNPKDCGCSTDRAIDAPAPGSFAGGATSCP